MFNTPIHIKEKLDELVVADLGKFQIAVRTKLNPINKQFFDTDLPVPERLYDTEGWVIHRGDRIVALLTGLEIGSLQASESDFAPIKRIAPTIPISFQVCSRRVLPEEIVKAALFNCKIPDHIMQYYAVFREIRPRFVKLYPFGGISEVIATTKRMLCEEELFIVQYAEQLRNVPFYKEAFNL